MATLHAAIDARGAVAGAAVFGKATRSMGFNAKGAQAQIKGLIGILAAFTVVKSAVRIMADFELTMRKVQGVTSQTDEQMKRMIVTARELGATTQFTATQAGEGLLFLSRAGFSASESLAALPATLNLAAAAGLELGFAADLASNVLRQFSLEADETVRVVDALLRVSNQANTDVRQLGEAMKFAGPIAGALGKTVEETAVLIGLLGDAGIQASQAGTNLRGTMLALTAPTGRAKKALEEMGLSVDSVNPAMQKTSVIFERFRKAGLTAAQAAALFGRRNAAAGLILSGSAAHIDDAIASLGSMNDAATIAALNMDTLSGSFKALVSAVQESFLAMGDTGFSGGLRSTVDLLTDVIRVLVGVDGHLKNNVTVVNAIVFALKLMFVRWSLILGLKLLTWARTLGIALWAATRAMLGFNAAIAANPIGLMLIAGAALIVWLLDMVAASNKAEQAIMDLGGGLNRFVDALNNAAKLPFIAFDARVLNMKAQIAGLEDAVKQVKAIGGNISPDLFTERGLKVPPTRKVFGQGVAGTEVVTNKQAIVSLELMIERIQKSIRIIREQEKAFKDRNAAAIVTTEEEKEAQARDARINRSIDILQREVVQMEFSNKVRGESIEGVARLTAELKVNNEFKKIQGDLTQREKVVFHELAEEVVDTAVAFAQLRQVANLQAFEAELDKFADTAGKTADEIELLAIRQDAYNAAIRNGLKEDGITEFVDRMEAKGRAMQKDRAATEEATRANQEWLETGRIVLDSIIDSIIEIALEGGKAKDVVKSLIKELAKLALRRSLTNLAGSFGVGVGLGAGGGGGGIPTTQHFSHGGLLVNKPTAFRQGVNIVGEAGQDEFVLPAVRGPGGKLGVALHGGGGGGGGVDNRRVTITNNFYDRGRDFDSFRRSTRAQKREARDFLRDQ